jgi:tRNA(fMet)-specific endonuclease VapC
VIKYLLDTNVISEAIKLTPNENVMRNLEVHEANIATASPVWHELKFGCKRLPVSRKRAMIERFLSDVIWPTLEILPYDEAAAEWHAEQRALLTNAGKAPAFTDGQIAAIAKVNQLILVTRNTSDYEGFSDLEVENWHE